jgi:hypothetical protein
VGVVGNQVNAEALTGEPYESMALGYACGGIQIYRVDEQIDVGIRRKGVVRHAENTPVDTVALPGGEELLEQRMQSGADRSRTGLSG